MAWVETGETSRGGGGVTGNISHPRSESISGEEHVGEPSAGLLSDAPESRCLEIRECDNTPAPPERLAILTSTDTAGVEPALIEEGTLHAFLLLSTGVPVTLEDVI